LLHADDTRCQILDVAPENIKTNAKGKPRTGQYTTGLVCKSGQNTIHLFMSGHCYAGENVGQVLNKRSSDKEMMYMADALSMNKPQVLSVALLAKIIIIYCLTHARRQFVKLLEIFPQEARYVVELIGKIYQNEAHCQKESFSPLERLSYHQQHSIPLLEEWHRWMHRQFTEHIIEPNSSLGSAIKYVLKRWHELTQFTRVAGAPLDNNLVERALRIPIRLRKSAYFYKTERGAMVGDRMMSLIYTCIAADEEPIGYLTALQENIKAVHDSPTCWLPWNYRAQLAAAATGGAAIEVGVAA
jgi:transposase